MLVAYCVPAALFFEIVAKRPQLVIVCITAAFFWLIALFASALLLRPVTLKDSIPQPFFFLILSISVLFQELAREGFVRIYARAEKAFAITSTNWVVFPLSDLTSSISAGVGYAAMHSLTTYGSILGSAFGPATYFSDRCSFMSVFVNSAWLAFSFSVIHVALMVIFFDAFRRHSVVKRLVVFVLHLAASFFTLINQVDSGCTISIPVLIVFSVLTLFITWKTITLPDYRSRLRGD